MDSRTAVENRHDALGSAACVLADQMRAAAIVTVTNSGHTARVIARYRPDPPIIAVTDSVRTLRSLALVWGCGDLSLRTSGTIRTARWRGFRNAWWLPGS